ncbi:low-complexity tail membrane protein [Vulcanococcus limneticus]|uniref:low-complexity tail membrane protein n=1 Tax=Vulcanococcus limneticus TaxID=2170428 RepID=UPI00398C217F
MAVSMAAPSPRSEPLLWLQLLALGLLPLEALLLLLLLGASDPGSLPLLERLLCWAIGVLAPAALLWRLPVDPWSLLVAQVPQRGRREIQQRLSALQPPAVLRLGSLVGLAILSLVLLWWCDNHAAFASAFSPVADSPRLLGLLLAAAVLALLQWQGQQVVQALWLLSRSPQEVAAATPLSAAALERERLSPGLPLLLLPPLRESLASVSIPSTAPFSAPPSAAMDPAAPPTAPSAPAPEDPPEGFASPSAVAAAIAIEPEESTEEQQSPPLDQEIR